jgi:hypothetical protein
VCPARSILYDSRLIIVQGYLRCGKVLILEGKLEKALEIYAYGLKMLPSEHPRRGVRRRGMSLLVLLC